MSVEFPMVYSVTPAKIIRKFLMDKGVIGDSPAVNTTHAWPSSYSKMPTEPPQIVTLYTGSPILDGHLMFGEAVVHPVVQIMARSEDPDVGDELLAAIQIIFNEVRATDFVQLQDSTGANRRFQLHSASPISNAAPLGAEHGENLIQGNSKIPREVAKHDRRLTSQTFRFSITEVEPTT